MWLIFIHGLIDLNLYNEMHVVPCWFLKPSRLLVIVIFLRHMLTFEFVLSCQMICGSGIYCKEGL
jgi:hypothetical protein